MAFEHAGTHVSVHFGAGDDAGICTITIGRPPVNALSREVQEELRAVAVAVNGDEDVRVVILSGGPKVFAAGADVKQMSQWTPQQALDECGPLQTSFDAVAAIRVPVIAQMSGYALGGGLELALCADIRIGDDTVRVGQPEVLLALIPGAGATQRLTRLIGPGRAKDLIFTGRQMKSDEAHACGLLNAVVPAESLTEHVLGIARGLARSSQSALRAAKRAIDVAFDGGLAQGLGVERAEFAALFAQPDSAYGFTSFFEHGSGKADFRISRED